MSRTYQSTLDEDDEDGDFDERGILKDGRSARTSMMMRDSLSALQRSVMQSHMKVVDAFGQAAGRRPGACYAAPAFSDGDDCKQRKRQCLKEIEDDYQKAELSVAWRGGLEAGDTFVSNGKLMRVTGHKDGKVQLRTLDARSAELSRQEAYDTYDRQITVAWKTQNSEETQTDCMTVDDAYRRYDEELVNAWRK